MKSVTEFQTHKLVKGLEAKKALAAEGKTSEEIQQNLGEAFKLEGDKLKYFFNALEVAEQNMDKLARILVVTFNEGESLPPKAMKVDEQYYVPEFQTPARAPVLTKPTKDPNKNKGKKSGGPRSSPWGMSPEEKAKKNTPASKTQAE